MHPEDRIWKSKAGLIEEGRIFLIYSFPVFSAIAQHNKLKNVAINKPMTTTKETFISDINTSKVTNSTLGSTS